MRQHAAVQQQPHRSRLSATEMDAATAACSRATAATAAPRLAAEASESPLLLPAPLPSRRTADGLAEAVARGLPPCPRLEEGARVAEAEPSAGSKPAPAALEKVTCEASGTTREAATPTKGRSSAPATSATKRARAPRKGPPTKAVALPVTTSLAGSVTVRSITPSTASTAADSARADASAMKAARRTGSSIQPKASSGLSGATRPIVTSRVTREDGEAPSARAEESEPRWRSTSPPASRRAVMPPDAARAHAAAAVEALRGRVAAGSRLSITELAGTVRSTTGATPSAERDGATRQATPARRAVSAAGVFTAPALTFTTVTGKDTENAVSAAGRPNTPGPPLPCNSESAMSGVGEDEGEGRAVRESEAPRDLVPVSDGVDAGVPDMVPDCVGELVRVLERERVTAVSDAVGVDVLEGVPVLDAVMDAVSVLLAVIELVRVMDAVLVSVAVEVDERVAAAVRDDVRVTAAVRVNVAVLLALAVLEPVTAAVTEALDDTVAVLELVSDSDTVAEAVEEPVAVTLTGVLVPVLLAVLLGDAPLLSVAEGVAVSLGSAPTLKDAVADAVHDAVVVWVTVGVSVDTGLAVCVGEGSTPSDSVDVAEGVRVADAVSEPDADTPTVRLELGL